MIQIGDRIPAVNVTVVRPDSHESEPADQLFAGKRVVLFAVPGAFTPTCSQAHLPGYVKLADEIFAKGVDMIACLSVNDPFVMRAWELDQGAQKLTMLADGGGALTKAMGLDMDTGEFGGVRSRRYAMVLEDSEVTLLNIEPPKVFDSSKAETILETLKHPATGL
ncbi:peroxiredoxin [Marinobacterium arenosum]|uniref:peroxiredoxin n=1 Tax=Marinobacterium arenosum TaxID=2862496 RepID=UPI001C953FA2|nr:peroxiredoxin [Marinobacterium arenosum]MBY4677321.1 peroxiredoxin [Marinobacterium arenosum]